MGDIFDLFVKSVVCGAGALLGIAAAAGAAIRIFKWTAGV